MAAYQKKIHELYMPKPSEKKKSELEQIQRKLKTNPRETKPYEDYLSALKDFNRQNKEENGTSPRVKRLPSVGSLPNLEKPPLGGSPNHFRNGRLSQPQKPAEEYHALQLSMGNRNMQYAKSKRVAAVGAELVNESELSMVQNGTGQNKREQLAYLNRKVKQFEEKVARDEMLARNKADLSGAAAA